MTERVNQSNREQLLHPFRASLTPLFSRRERKLPPSHRAGENDRRGDSILPNDGSRGAENDGSRGAENEGGEENDGGEKDGLGEKLSMGVSGRGAL